MICSGRIERAHAEAIKQFMEWLQYEKYKQKFCFIYNKADLCSALEKAENISHMCEAFGVDPQNSTKVFFPDSDELRAVNLNLALGFPPDSSYEKTKADSRKLMAVTIAPFPESRIPVDKSICNIL